MEWLIFSLTGEPTFSLKAEDTPQIRKCNLAATFEKRLSF